MCIAHKATGRTSILLCSNCGKEINEEFNYCPNCAFPLKFQMNPTTLSKLFGEVETDEKWIHRRAQERLWKMGRDYGFWVRLEYEVPDLVVNGKMSRIDVAWISQDRVTAAFEVRIKKHNLDVPTTRKDIRKLKKLRAQEKFIVNVSSTTGKAYFYRVSEKTVVATPKPLRSLERFKKYSTHAQAAERKPLDRPRITQEQAKSYSVEEIRRDYPRAYEKWTPEEDKALVERYKEGVTISQLARVHQRKLGAIHSRLRKLGLPE